MTDKAARRARFEKIYPKIADELIAKLRDAKFPEIIIIRYRKSLDYNVPGGKLNRGMSVVDTVEILKRRPLSDDEYIKAAVLGWCVELLQAYFLTADDIMDSSITRRGKPCWYRNPGTGVTAITDSSIIAPAIFRLIKTYFAKESYFVDLIELLLESIWRTQVGQLMDLVTSSVADLDKFSLERHSMIIIWKTAFYSFYLPVAFAMYMCGIPHTSIPSIDVSEPPKDPYDIAKSILIPLGEYFQIQDDFLDFAGTPAEIGKIGTDIVENKCSWCVNMALLHATPAQRQVIREHYGKKPSGGPSELKIKVLFEEIGIREYYTAYEEKIVGLIRERIAKVPEIDQDNTLRRDVFEALLDNIYQRKK